MEDLTDSEILLLKMHFQFNSDADSHRICRLIAEVQRRRSQDVPCNVCQKPTTGETCERCNLPICQACFFGVEGREDLYCQTCAEAIDYDRRHDEP